MCIRDRIYGRYRELEVVGIASSPEFVFAVAPGAMLPEPERFGVVWMGREALGRAFDVDGAFNDVVFRLAPRADARDTIFAIDARLARPGGRVPAERVAVAASRDRALEHRSAEVVWLWQLLDRAALREIRNRVRAAGRGDRCDRRQLPRRLHGDDLPQGVSHPESGVRCGHARLCMG